VIARKPSASPATGYNKVHVEEQKNTGGAGAKPLTPAPSSMRRITKIKL